nr:MAG TPA: hypothetical protein [Caudoviricetes sp.]
MICVKIELVKFACGQLATFFLLFLKKSKKRMEKNKAIFRPTGQQCDYGGKSR